MRPVMLHAPQAARMFKILSVQTRLRLLELLRGRTLCVNALSANLGVTPAAVSQHLRVLREADLVRAEKRGYHVHYQLNERTLAAWGRLAAELLAPPAAPGSGPGEGPPPPGSAP
ncbi:helix-turn-helix domain-containing protein [Desulfocurvus sp.]|jgi:DNA-binding transcriptional ArsR family regulator|uniref:ArsR/SmtB family transcription factor n=1 Tax=Desulfocurvus sp. TaxID=2871698 RepID=UPI0025BC6E21|nr:helix-turn-helix domain-containing protein [Desulfocurvus sp.]MCK9240444.1 helix-turn-helix domain-containing protein [Desulfocurvus sp.]